MTEEEPLPIPVFMIETTARGHEMRVNFAAPDFVAAVEVAEPLLAVTKTRVDRDAALDAFRQDLLARWLARFRESTPNNLLVKAADIARRMIASAVDEEAPL